MLDELKEGLEKTIDFRNGKQIELWVCENKGKKVNAEVFVVVYFNIKGIILKRSDFRVDGVGCPDFYFEKDGERIYVEVKTGMDGLKYQQIRWLMEKQYRIIVFYLKQKRGEYYESEDYEEMFDDEVDEEAELLDNHDTIAENGRSNFGTRGRPKKKQNEDDVKDDVM